MTRSAGDPADRIAALGDGYEPEIFRLLEELVNINSFSGNQEGLIRAGELIQDRAAELGLELEQAYPDDDRSKPFNLILKTDSQARPVGLIGHFDTVHPPESGFLRMTREGDRLRGPGTQDMKSGLVTALFAVRVLADLEGRLPPVKLILNCDEEIGSVGSRPLIETEMAGARAVLVLEGRLAQRDQLVTARKGIAGAWVEVFGKAAHASMGLDQGASAVLEMALKVAALDQLNTRLNDPAAGISVSTGLIQGGTVMNTIPDFCRAEVDIRFATPQAEEMVCAAIRDILENNSVPGTRTEYQLMTGRPAMAESPEAEELARGFQRAAAVYGRVPEFGPTGGGSDANFTGALGIPTLDGLGPVGGGPHTQDEYLVTASLMPNLKALCLFIHGLLSA